MDSNKPPKIFYVVFLIVAIFFLGCSTNADTGKMAPGFKLEDTSGGEVTLKQHRGKIVLLDFWATWCQPCLYSIPELVKLQEKYRDQGVVILGISIDDHSYATNEYLSAFKKKFNINYTIMRADQAVTRKYFGNRRFPIPQLFVINQAGIIEDIVEGFLPGAVEMSLKKVLK